MAKIVYRDLSEEDARPVSQLALEAWRFTYRDILEEPFIEDFLRQNYAPEALATLVSAVESGQMFFNVAERSQKIVGFCNIGIADQEAELH